MAMPLEFIEVTRGRGAEVVEHADTDNSSDANPSPTIYDSEVDTDDEFQARLAESYKHHSPSRSRRLAKSGQSSPTNHAQHFPTMMPQVPYQPYQVLAPASACVYPPPTQLPLLPDKAQAAVPAPPAAAPRLSQVFVAPPPPSQPAPNPEEATWSWQSLDAPRRDSDSSSVEDIRRVDLAIHASSEAKQSWASTQAPSTPCSDSGHDYDADCDKSASGTPQGSRAKAAKRSEKAKPKPVDDNTAEAIGEEAMASWPEGVVTLMIRQLPRSCTHVAFLDEVARRGFKGLFDFIYFPYDLKKGSNVGFGFINFLTPQCAAAFVRDFDGLYLDEKMRSTGKPLRIHPASVQGYEANLACFSKNKSVTRRDSSFSPLFLPGGSWASLETGGDQAGKDTSRRSASEAERKAEGPYGVVSVASPQFSPQGHAAGAASQQQQQQPVAGQIAPAQGADQNSYQWMSLEEEKQKLLQELASVQGRQRALQCQSTMMTMPVASPQPR